MDVIREVECDLENGSMVKIITLSNKDKNGTKTCEVLVNSKGEAITPEVKRITFDKDNQMFLVRDKLAIDEYLTGSINYYINYQGIPIGLCFFDLFNGFYTMEFNSSEEYKSGYFSFKLAMAQRIRSEVQDKVENDLGNCKKMALYKKGVIESENKI
jgi:hypothetical protein